MDSLTIVSGIITTYKREPKYVIRAAKSILNQTYPHMELIIVDDSPSDYYLRDAVKQAVEELPGNVVYVQHVVNKGACVARNTGLAIAKGQYVGFLDDDDEWYPNKVESMLPLFSNEETALVYCGAEVKFVDSNRVEELKREYHKGKIYQQLLVSNFIGSTSFPLIKKDCLINIGGFDEQMPSCQDYDVWLRLSKKYEVNYTKAVLVRYYMHNNEQISKNNKNVLIGNMRIIEKNIDSYKKNKRAYGARLFSTASAYAGLGNFGDFVRTSLKGLFMTPFTIKENFEWLYIGMVNYYRSKKR